jgi:dienelactone hydrolase
MQRDGFVEAACDEAVSPEICRRVAQRSITPAPMCSSRYPGAKHDFDDPGEKRQDVPGNRAAKADATARAAEIVGPIRD